MSSTNVVIKFWRKQCAPRHDVFDHRIALSSAGKSTKDWLGGLALRRSHSIHGFSVRSGESGEQLRLSGLRARLRVGD